MGKFYESITKFNNQLSKIKSNFQNLPQIRNTPYDNDVVKFEFEKEETKTISQKL